MDEDEIAEHFRIEKERREKAFFEEAIGATEFGKFNIIVLLMSVPGTAAIIFSATTMAYVIPSAECDLELSLVDKGHLNAVTYLGMIVSALPWAILTDVMGRKIVVVLAHMFDAIFVFASALSGSKKQLLICRFFEGFCICGGFSALVIYIAEVNSQQFRSRVILMTGIMLSFAELVMPTIATVVIPTDWEVRALFLELRSWQIFILITALPSLIVGIGFIFLPETPKFDLSTGRHEKAFDTFRLMFTMNTGLKADLYPFEETDIWEARESHFAARLSYKTTNFFLKFKRQLQALLSKKYLDFGISLIISDFCVLMCQNTLRLWLPQFFVSIETYNRDFSIMPSLCQILKYNVDNEKIATAEDKPKCIVIIPPKSYVNNIIVNVVSIIGYLMAINIIDTFGVKKVLCICLCCCSILGFALYFATTKLLLIIISALYLALLNIAASSIMIVTVIVFPSEIRNTVVAFSLTAGRAGSVIGNLSFPYLIRLGCMPPLFWLGAVSGVGCLFALLMPYPSRPIIS